MKILYLMWIDWRWIWQRPQILASKLASEYDVTVLFPQNVVSRQRMQRNNPYPSKYKKAYVVPLYDKAPILQFLMNLVIRWCMRDVGKYDVVWVGHPLFEKFIPVDYEGKIIYDCMDNHAALSGSEAKGKIVDEEEKRLAGRSDLVFATGSLLKQKMEKYVKLDTDVVLVRNGYDLKCIYEVDHAEKKSIYKLGYIGTISEWMDYSTVIHSIEKCHDIEYHFIGLISGNHYVKKDRLYYEGVVEHHALYDKVKGYDCLIMPFVVNDIVLSVDPVKLYEYISFGKCIISVYYPEIERFGEYVYFYHTPEEYCELVSRLSESGFPPKYSRESQMKFLEENTWDKRFETITESIGKRING